MHYDRDWTSHERARVEAIRLLMPSRGDLPDVDALIDAAGKLATFILGPEASYPFPWDKAAEARRKLDDLMWRGPDGKPVSCAQDGSEIIATYRELADILHLIPDGSEVPF